MLGMYASNVNRECFVRREGSRAAQGDLSDLGGGGGCKRGVGMPGIKEVEFRHADGKMIKLDVISE